MGLTRPAKTQKSETLIVWLPTQDGRPIPSSPLIAEIPEPSGPADLQPWATAVIPLAVNQWPVFLGQCAGREVLGPGLIPGKDLSFWV